MTTLTQKIDEIAHAKTRQFTNYSAESDKYQYIHSAFKSAIYSGIEEALKMEPSETVQHAGYRAVGDSHYSPMAEHLQGWGVLANHVFRAMRAAQWEEIEKERK
jgi:hypothetical protein